MKAAGVSIDITKNIDKWKKSNDFTLLGNYYIHAGMAEYYLEDYEAADEHLKNGEYCLAGQIVNIPNREWHIFHVLNSLRLLKKIPAQEELNEVMSNIQPVLEKLELWTSFGPALKPYLTFIKAEIERIKGDFRETRNLYLDAIDIAQEEEYTLEVFRSVWRTGNTEYYPVSFYRDQRIAGWRENYVYKLPSGEIVAVYDDITERKQAEEDLARHRDHLETLVKERTEKLNMANQELNDFAYIVSHDLKAPLRGITQLAGWLADDYANAFDKDGKEQMDMLIGRTRRMHDMIEGILQYSRIGRITRRVNEVDLNALVNEIIEIISPSKSIQITIKNKLPNVYCDETAIYQVFQNLLDNAVKYLDKPEGRINVAAVSEDGNWRFCVSDNGPGIEERHRKKIFQMFQTLKPKDETGSTGIGLALVKKIVNNWDGSIRLESEVEAGSKFFFTMPKKEAKDEKQQTDTAG